MMCFMKYTSQSLSKEKVKGESFSLLNIQNFQLILQSRLSGHSRFCNYTVVCEPREYQLRIIHIGHSCECSFCKLEGRQTFLEATPSLAERLACILTKKLGAWDFSYSNINCQYYEWGNQKPYFSFRSYWLRNMKNFQRLWNFRETFFLPLFQFMSGILHKWHFFATSIFGGCRLATSGAKELRKFCFFLITFFDIKKRHPSV